MRGEGGKRLRIVSLAPSVTSILCELGAADSLVAVTRWCKDVVPAEVLTGLPVFDDCWSADASRVAALTPDLIVGSVPYRAEVVAGMLERGLRFIATSPRTLEDIASDIRLLARLVGKETRGERLIKVLREGVAAVARQVERAQTRPRVYCEVWPNPLRSCEPWVEELVAAAGGEFVPRPAGRQVSAEEVIAADPEIIVLAWAATGERARADKVRERAGWETVRAVRGGRIHVLRDELLNTPSPILLRGLDALVALIHPEIFRGA